MKRMLILLSLIGSVLAGSTDFDEFDLLDTPDAIQYLDELLNQLFQTFTFTTADSLALSEHGYSPFATSIILAWQKRDDEERTFRSLRYKLAGSDRTLLENDIKKETWQTHTHLRQRMQYSTSMSGWRILNKGRVRSMWGDFHVITEQDPGEENLTDHSALSFITNSVPGFDEVILGDYHVNLGKGMIINQRGSRMSLNPRTLNRKVLISIRPHYSSREVDYFRGFAANFIRENLRVSLFLSRRNAIGMGNGAAFKEDADGIHPAGKNLQKQVLTHGGAGWESKLGFFRLFGAAIYSPSADRRLLHELGISTEVGMTHFFHFHTDGLVPNDSRMIFGWTYASKPMILATQYRRFRSERGLEVGNLFTQLGNSAMNEEGMSARLQLRPTKGIQLRYALEAARASQLLSFGDLKSILQHRIQFVRQNNAGSIQLDLSNKRENPAINGDVWNDQTAPITTNKGALSIVKKFPGQLDYRINLKIAKENANLGFLVQHRLNQDMGKMKWSMGYVRFSIPLYGVRLSVYETGLAESYSFYTAYDDGERWFIYLKHRALNFLNIELKISQTSAFDNEDGSKQLAGGFQLSIVL